MEITINGKIKILTQVLTLTDLLAEVCSDSRYVIVEQNGKIVPRPEWPTAKINGGDEIELVTFVGGG